MDARELHRLSRAGRRCRAEIDGLDGEARYLDLRELEPDFEAHRRTSLFAGQAPRPNPLQLLTYAIPRRRRSVTGSLGSVKLRSDPVFAARRHDLLEEAVREAG